MAPPFSLMLYIVNYLYGCLLSLQYFVKANRFSLKVRGFSSMKLKSLYVFTHTKKQECRTGVIQLVVIAGEHYNLI